MSFSKKYCLAMLFGLTNFCTYGMHIHNQIAQHPVFEEATHLFAEVDLAIAPFDSIDLATLPQQQRIQLVDNCAHFGQRIQILSQRMRNMPIPFDDNLAYAYAFLNINLQLRHFLIERIALKFSLLAAASNQ